VCWVLGFQRTNAAEYSAPSIQQCSAAQVAANSISYADAAAYVRRVYGEVGVLIELAPAGALDQSGVTMIRRDLTDIGQVKFVASDGTDAALCDDTANNECFCPVMSNNLDLGDPGILYSPIATHFDTRYYVNHYFINPTGTPLGISQPNSLGQSIAIGEKADYTQCCQACSEDQPPPSPPADPQAPATPPLPPGGPPPPPDTTTGSTTINPRAASASVLGPDNMQLGCRGVVFWTDSMGREVCTLRSRADIATGNSLNTLGTYSGSYVFAYHNPPPPPNLPSSAVCNGFQFHQNSQIPQTHAVDATSNLVPGIEGTSIVVANVDNPWE